MNRIVVVLGAVLLGLLGSSGCGGSTAEAPPPVQGADDETGPDGGLGTRAPPEAVQSFGPLAGSPAAAPEAPAATTAAPAALDAPAWGGARIAAAQAPAPAVQAWSRARNRARCALLVPATLAQGEGARPRAGREPGGWRVVWDHDGRRDAFGVAGTAVETAADAPPGLTLRRQWADGSRADYGREGSDDDSPYAAQLHVEGQGCVYRLWSHLGRDHLEHLLEHLQWVEPQ